MSAGMLPVLAVMLPVLGMVVALRARQVVAAPPLE